MYPALRSRAPAALERAAGHEHRGAAAGSVVDGEGLYVEDLSERTHISALYRLVVLAAESAAVSVGPVFLLKTGAGADAVVVPAGEAGAVAADRRCLEVGAGPAALAVYGDYLLGEGAHALFTVEVYIRCV